MCVARSLKTTHTKPDNELRCDADVFTSIFARTARETPYSGCFVHKALPISCKSHDPCTRGSIVGVWHAKTTEKSEEILTGITEAPVIDVCIPSVVPKRPVLTFCWEHWGLWQTIRKLGRNISISGLFRTPISFQQVVVNNYQHSQCVKTLRCLQCTGGRGRA